MTSVAAPTLPATDDVLIRASAGTGKTFQLSNRFLARLFEGVPVDRILATTFTRKAAGEILERVLVRLARVVADDDERESLVGFLERPLSAERCRRTLRDLTRQLHRVRVGTLDGFFSRIAKSHTLELGLPPGWDIAEEREASRLVGRAVEAVLHDDTPDDVRRMMHLLSKGAANRAVAETVWKTVETFHGLFLESDYEAWHRFAQPRFPSAGQLDELILQLQNVELPNDKRWRAAREKDVETALEGNWEGLIEKGLAARVLNGETTYYKKEIEPDVRDLYLRLLDVARSHVVEAMRTQTEATYALLEKYDAVYSRMKRADRSLRFDDVTRHLAEGLSVLDATRLAYRLDGRIDHILLDEFQDTSIAQWEVVRAFATGVAGPRADRSLFCVGDTKQAIYRWRGGVAEIFDTLEETFDLRTVELDVSHRSAPVVIETVNRVFENAGNVPQLDNLEGPVRAWCDRFRHHETARADLEGFVQLHVADPQDDERSAEDCVIERTVRVVADVVGRSPGASVGVLARSNKRVGRVVHALRRAGIPASEEGGNPLVDSAAIGLVLSLLKIADHPGSTAPRFHVATSPLAGPLGFADHRDDVAAAALSERIRRSLVEKGYGRVVLEWARMLAPHCSERDANRLRQLVRLAHDFQPTSSLRTRDFVDFVRVEKVAAPSRHDVRVMTIHQSKGLQFDAVVLPELDQELFKGRESYVVGRDTPTSPPERICLYRNAAIRQLLPPEWRDVFADNEVAKTGESLCLLYVALTRAVHELQMIVEAPVGRSSKKTYAKLLRHTLGGGAKNGGGEVLYEDGEPTWRGAHLRCAERDTHDEPDEDQARRSRAPQALRITLAPMPEGRRRGLDRIAPSANEGSRRVKLHDVLDVGSAVARDRGTLIHGWFEHVMWLEEGLPEDRELTRLAEELGAPGEMVGECRDRFREMLRAPGIAWMLSRKSYDPPRDLAFDEGLRRELAAEPLRLEVHNERRFAVRDGASVVTGSIDRLVLMFRGTRLVAADIIDFKTDFLPAGDEEAVAAKIAHYRGQLETYRPAVATMYRLDPSRISARLAFLSTGRVERV